MAVAAVKPAAIDDNVAVVGPEQLFSGEPYRHVLSAASGSRPLPVLPPSACETNEVQQADTSISLGTCTPLIIGIDTEYVQVGALGDKTNRILSYQFAAICSEGAWRGIIYCENNERLTLSGLLGFVLELGVRSKLLRKWPAHITVGAHHSNAELASFKDFPKIKREFDAIRKTFTTVRRPYEASYCDRSKHKYSFQVSLIDTQHLTPGGKALAVLGDIYEFPKLSLPPDCDKSRMDLFLQKHPSEFEQYAIRDAEISAFHLYRLHRFARTVLNENEIPLTLASIGLKYLRNLWKKADIDEVRVLGLEIIPPQKKFNPRTQRFLTTKPRIVKSFDRDMYEILANQCYHGGRNETFVFGVTEKDIWTDFDLVGAYTTAMAAIRTPDYKKIQNSRKIEGYQADVMGFAKVRFRFSENTRFPCLPVVSRDDHGLIFPLEGEAFVGAPEIALARQMGAEIEVVQGAIIPWADKARPFEEFVKDTQKRRGNEKGTFEDKMWKEIGNSLYGKTAQGLREKS